MRRRHIRGKWATLSIRTIAQLMDIPYKDCKDILYKYGTARSNSLTLKKVGLLIWEQISEAKIKQLRSQANLRDPNGVFKEMVKEIRKKTG